MVHGFHIRLRLPVDPPVAVEADGAGEPPGATSSVESLRTEPHPGARW
jgi:hypothetical protein